MLDMQQTGIVEAKGTIRALKLHRETLRELNAGGSQQAHGGKRTYFCLTDFGCTRACPKTVTCGGELNPVVSSPETADRGRSARTPLTEDVNMLDMNPTASLEARKPIRELKLNRETLRELGAGEFLHAQAARHTLFCEPSDFCTRRCGPATKKC